MWYYESDGQSMGPVEHRDLAELVRRGMLKPDDRVWHPDFGSEWRPARTVEGLFEVPPAMSAQSSGSGGETPNSEIARRAREALSGRWGGAIGFLILLQILTVCIAAAAGMLDAVVPMSSLLIQLIVVPPLSVGGFIFFLALARRQPTEMGMMFSGFRSWWPACGAYIAVMLLTILWAVLALLPFVGMGLLFGSALRGGGGLAAAAFAAAAGTFFVAVMVVVTLRYILAMMFIADDPSCGPMEAVRRSVSAMQGRKWKLSCLGFRILGWLMLFGLVAAILMGVSLSLSPGGEPSIPLLISVMIVFLAASIWTSVYWMAAVAVFFDDLKPPVRE